MRLDKTRQVYKKIEKYLQPKDSGREGTRVEGREMWDVGEIVAWEWDQEED